LVRYTGVLGILAVLLAAWLGSTDRKHIRWRTVAWGLGLQVTFAFLVLRFDYGQRAMTWAGGVVNNMLAATFAGTRVLFGQLGLPNSGAFGYLLPPNSGAIFAFQVLPTIIFISAFFAVLYHIGLMQIIIRAMAWVMLKTMRISGAESMNVAASIFMGQTEAPLTIRPFLSKATRSELMDDDHDQRHGARLRRHHGHVHFAGCGGTASAVGRHHDFAGNDFDCEDAGAGNRRTSDRGKGRNSQGRDAQG
jgi:CNT family concentrative nucleoside transporter